MTWDKKYWDSVDQFYWTPAHLGLASINRKHWGDDPETIRLPRSVIKNGGALYTRSGTSKQNEARMRGLEETLNHIFDITFAIAPDVVLAELFFLPLGIRDGGAIERIGRDIKVRYGWGENNVTQQDMFLATTHSAVGVELKLASKTRKDQVLKYLALMVWEEHYSGRRANLGLLYVTPGKSDTLWKDCGATPDAELPASWLDTCQASKLNPLLRAFIANHKAHFNDAVSRIRLARITWIDLLAGCRRIGAQLDTRRVGDDTLARLLSGFEHAVLNHAGTGIVPKVHADD